MPVVAYRIQPDIYQAIQRLITAGEYSSVEEFIERAVRNQLELELDAGSPREIHAFASPPSGPTGGGNGFNRRAILGVRPGEMPASNGTSGKASPSTTFSVPSDGLELPAAVEAVQRSDEPVWGQINRFLPMKLACRRVLALSHGEKSWPLLSQAMDGLAEQAAAIGSTLHAADIASGRKRDQLATGLPRSDGPESQERFLTQIVAKVVRGGMVHPGAVAAYGLAAIVDGVIALTNEGVRFATMRNPVLDADPLAAETTLSTEERMFLVSTVVPSMQTELSDYRLVLDALRRGHAKPESLHAVIEPTFSGRRWTAAMVRTHLSGLLSRMIELETVARSWEGRNVSYSLGPLAAMVPHEPANTANQGGVPS
jgi:hypothetical protein